ncbi:gliding motility-associated C-terminal domain-containing protein [Vicingaceae bacterium]|nr:gliding motility-associated C-terminal domain-containing protein [Vicingaceae bacterium]
MNKENKPIEDLFKDAFEHFEKTPSSNVWSGIQAGINAPAAGVAAATKGVMSIGAKIGIAVATIGVIATTLYVGFINVNEKEVTVAQQELINQQETIPTAVVEEENNSTEIITEEAEYLASESVSSTDRIEVISTIENSKKQVKVSDDKTNSSTVKGLAKLNQRTETGETSLEIIESNDAVSDKQEITNSNAVEPSQKDENIIEEVAPLAAIINVNQVNGEIPFQLTFNTPENADTYTWKLNGLIISNNKSSSIEVTTRGTQKLELIITKGDETAQSIQMIDAEKSTATVIQNIFTPNQDGMNDVFRIEEGFDQLSIKIFDQNYKELHNWTGEYGFWDGTYPDGSMAPNGVYFYMGTYKKNGKEETLKGSVTLRR